MDGKQEINLEWPCVYTEPAAVSGVGDVFAADILQVSAKKSFQIKWDVGMGVVESSRRFDFGHRNYVTWDVATKVGCTT